MEKFYVIGYMMSNNKIAWQLNPNISTFVVILKSLGKKLERIKFYNIY